MKETNIKEEVVEVKEEQQQPKETKQEETKVEKQLSKLEQIIEEEREKRFLAKQLLDQNEALENAKKQIEKLTKELEEIKTTKSTNNTFSTEVVHTTEVENKHDPIKVWEQITKLNKRR